MSRLTTSYIRKGIHVLQRFNVTKKTPGISYTAYLILSILRGLWWWWWRWRWW